MSVATLDPSQAIGKISTQAPEMPKFIVCALAEAIVNIAGAIFLTLFSLPIRFMQIITLYKWSVLKDNWIVNKSNEALSNAARSIRNVFQLIFGSTSQSASANEGHTANENAREAPIPQERSSEESSVPKIEIPSVSEKPSASEIRTSSVSEAPSAPPICEKPPEGSAPQKQNLVKRGIKLIRDNPKTTAALIVTGLATAAFAFYYKEQIFESLFGDATEFPPNSSSQPSSLRDLFESATNLKNQCSRYLSEDPTHVISNISSTTAVGGNNLPNLAKQASTWLPKSLLQSMQNPVCFPEDFNICFPEDHVISNINSTAITNNLSSLKDLFESATNLKNKCPNISPTAITDNLSNLKDLFQPITDLKDQCLTYLPEDPTHVISNTSSKNLLQSAMNLLTNRFGTLYNIFNQLPVNSSDVSLPNTSDSLIPGSHNAVARLPESLFRCPLDSSPPSNTTFFSNLSSLSSFGSGVIITGTISLFIIYKLWHQNLRLFDKKLLNAIKLSTENHEEEKSKLEKTIKELREENGRLTAGNQTLKLQIVGDKREKSQVEGLKSKNKNLEDISNQLQKQIDFLTKNQEEALSLLETKLEKERKYKKSIELLRTDVSELTQKLKEAQASKSEFENKNRGLQNQNSELTQQLNKTKNENQQTIEKFKSRLGNTNKSIQSLTKTIEQKTQKIEKLEKEMKELNTIAKKTKTLAQQLQGNAEKLEKEKSELTQKLKKADETPSQNTVELERNKETYELKNEIQELVEKGLTLTEEHNKLANDYNELVKDYNSLVENHKELETANKKLNYRLNVARGETINLELATSPDLFGKENPKDPNNNNS